MDRDIALQLSSKLNDIKTSLTTLATNTTPSPTDSRSVENQRSLSDPEEELEAPAEEPETVPETTTRKRTTSK